MPGQKFHKIGNMAKNIKDIKTLVLDKPKIMDIYYIIKMTLRDTRSWFRMGSRMTLRIKANRS